MPFEWPVLQPELAQLVGRQVDMRTPADLSRYFRPHVVESAVVKYAA